MNVRLIIEQVTRFLELLYLGLQKIAGSGILIIPLPKT